MNTLVFAAAIAAATNLTTTAELPVVIVEASRLDHTASEIPGQTQVITQDEIAASGARDAVDLLEKKAPFIHTFSLSGNNPAMKQITMGGYGENGFGRVVILVDGEKLNNPDMDPPNLSRLPLSAINRIEVLTGPQTVLHGDGASAGLINIITEPEEADDALHGAIELHGGNHGTIGGSAALRGAFAEENLSYWSYGGWDHSDGYRHNSEYDLYNINGGLKKTFGNGSYLRVSAFESDADYGLPGPLSREEWHHSPTQSHQPKDDFYRRISYGFNVSAAGVIDEDNTVKLTATLSRREMKSRTTSFYYGVAYPWNIQYDLYSLELTPQWINTSALGDFANEFTLGATYRYDRNHARSGNGSWTKYATTRQTAGFFAQDTLNLTDELALQLGARYERAWLDGSKYIYGRDTRLCNLFAYDAALLYTPVEDLKTYLRFSRHYRTPFIDENSGKILAPETGFTTEVGADYAFLDDFSVGGRLFHSRLKHEIFYSTWYNAMWLSWDGLNVNSPDDTVREGASLHLGWERDKVAGLTLAYAYVNAEFDGGAHDGKTIPGVSKSTVSLSGRVWLWDDCFVFGGYRYQSEQYSISDFKNDLPTIPAFGLFHVGVSYAPSYAALKGWKASLTIDNLFDKNYCNYATYGENYWPGSGRSLLVTLSYAF